MHIYIYIYIYYGRVSNGGEPSLERLADDGTWLETSWKLCGSKKPRCTVAPGGVCVYCIYIYIYMYAYIYIYYIYIYIDR